MGPTMRKSAAKYGSAWDKQGARVGYLNYFFVSTLTYQHRRWVHTLHLDFNGITARLRNHSLAGLAPWEERLFPDGV